MQKVIRDGKVAVIYSPGFGAGWYSWHVIKELLYDPVVVSMLESGKTHYEIESYCYLTYGEDNYFSCDDLVIEWVPIGREFIIHEYDGSESIWFKDEMRWETA